MNLNKEKELIKSVKEFIRSLKEDDVYDFVNNVCNSDITNLEIIVHQLEEKNKIIDDNFKKAKHLYNMLNHYEENHLMWLDQDLCCLYQNMNKDLKEMLEIFKNEGEKNESY